MEIKNYLEKTKNCLKKTKKITIVSILVVLGLLIGLFIYWMFFLKPSIKLIGHQDLYLSLGEKYQEKGIKATVLFRNLSSAIKIKENINNQKIGKYYVNYFLTYHKKEYKITRNVYVKDYESPIITLSDEEIISCQNADYTKFPYQAFDNYDLDITDKVIIKKEEIDKDNYKLNYYVEDSSGNKGENSKIIKVQDKEKPSITLKGKKDRKLLIGYKYQEAGYTAIDNCDGDLTNKVKVTGRVDSNKTGTYKINYSVTDSNGNTTTTSRTITIIDVDPTANKIFLTFDDGPSTNITPKILDILKEKGVKATFFVVGFGSNKEYLIKRIVNEGHTIAIHGMSHEYSVIYKSVDSYMNNIDSLNNKIKNLTGVDTRITRFPGGSSNTVSRKYSNGIMSKLVNEVVARGYYYYDWNISSGDAGGTTSSSGVYNNVINGLKYNRHNVVLMHDLNNKTYTANALKDIIEYGLESGYSFDRLTESVPMVTLKVNN